MYVGTLHTPHGSCYDVGEARKTSEARMTQISTFPKSIMTVIRP